MLKSKMNFVLIIALLFTVAVQSFGQTITPATKKQVNKLIAVLKSDAPYKEKADICRQLAVFGNKDSIEALASLLGDEKLSHMARYGLETIPDPAVDDALRKALGKLKGRPLVGVISSIGVRRDAKAVGQLKKMLQDPDVQVAQAAARALGKIGNSAAAKAMQGALPKASAANKLALCEGLFRCAEALAARGHRKKAIAIYDQLRNLREPYQVRIGALRGAILTRQKGGLKLLKKHLRSDDYVLFSAAVQTAQELPGTEVTNALTAVLNQLPADNQILVIETLAKRADTSALPTLFALAKRGRKPVRMAAIRALPEIGHASAVSVLKELLDDADLHISETAKESFAALPGRKVDAAVMVMLNSNDTSQRLTAIEIIGRRRTKAAIPALLKAARDTDPQVRPAALKKVGELGGPAELPAMLDTLLHLKDSKDLDAAEQALRSICAKADNPQSHTEKLINLLNQAHGEQKSTLLNVLGTIGGTNALEAVREAVNDQNAEVRAAAIRVLCAWKNADAAGDLLALVKTSPNTSHKIAALRGYVRLTGLAKGISSQKKLEMYTLAMKYANRPDEKKLVLGGLANVGELGALQMAQNCLKDEQTKAEAAVAAVKIAGMICDTYPQEVKAAMNEVISISQDVELRKQADEISGKVKDQGDFTKIEAVRIFDGISFTGWEGNLDAFRIEDGAIVGGTLKGNVPLSEYLCTKKEYADFELRLMAKLTGQGNNAGVQFRSRRANGDHGMIGYQADMGMHGGNNIWGSIYDEGRRRRFVATANQEELAKVFRPGDWNEYVIRCFSRRIQIWVNGYQTVDCKEPDGKIEQKGIIGLQIHKGPPCEAWYKDIVIKEIHCKQ